MAPPQKTAAPKKAAPARKATKKGVVKKSAAKKPAKQVPKKVAKKGTKTAKKPPAKRPTAKKSKAPAPKKAAPAKRPASKATAKGKTGNAAKPAKAVPAKKKTTPPKKTAPAKTTKSTAPAKAAPPPKKAAPTLPPARKVPPRKPGSVICPLSGWEVMPAKPNFSERTLKRLRQKLMDERDQQIRQAEDLQHEAEELAQERDPGDTQFDEESGEGDTVNVERERDLLLSASARQIVDAIDRALKRMDVGTYGVCVPAGRRLSVERLEAIPYAEECVDCKARAERRR